MEDSKSIELHPPDSNWGGFRGCYDYDLGYKRNYSIFTTKVAKVNL